MASGADLFVVCKECGAEVSPYITECPYCGHRVRRRAPKLPRESSPARARLGALKRTAPRQARARAPVARRGLRIALPGVAAESHPYASLAVVGASLVLWVAWQAGAVGFGQLIVAGPLHGQWWRLLTNLFVYGAGLTAYVYAFTVLVAVFVFGWLLERRHGGVVVLAVFLGAGVAGAVATLGVYPHDGVATGANAAALALLVAWAIPDALAARAGNYYEGDLLAVAALGLALLAMPFARPEASWVAGVVGALLGLVMGVGLARMGTDAV